MPKYTRRADPRVGGLRKATVDEASMVERMALQVALLEYDFSKDGGAVATLAMGDKIPDNSLVYDIILYRPTACTSGGSATIQLLAGSTALTDAIAYDAPTATYSFKTNSTLSGTTAEPILVSSGGILSFKVATAALTAGKLQFVVLFAGLTLN